MKKGLVLEGGAMRGMYTAGVLDVFLDEGLEFDGIVGVSAGALFGVNFLSKQKGRVIRYNKKYNSDRNYMGIKPLLKTGNYFNKEYVYDKVPREQDVFDDETYKKSGVPFYAVMTNFETGEAEYTLIESVFDQMDELRASGSMPFLSKPVKIGDNYYMDGAIVDSIPFDFMFSKGYDDLTVILTKPAGYVKKPMPAGLTDLFYKRKNPVFAEKVKNRYLMYNDQMERLNKLEEEKKIKVIRPSEIVEVSRTEKDSEKLENLYQLGIRDAKEFLKREGLKD